MLLRICKRIPATLSQHTTQFRRAHIYLAVAIEHPTATFYSLSRTHTHNILL